MEHIPVPHPQLTDQGKVQIATEIAFASLLAEAAKLGIPLLPTMGLMYLPSQEVTRKFKDSCRAVLDSLRSTYHPA
jgi:hypothetical protein